MMTKKRRRPTPHTDRPPSKAAALARLADQANLWAVTVDRIARLLIDRMPDKDSVRTLLAAHAQARLVGSLVARFGGTPPPLTDPLPLLQIALRHRLAAVESPPPVTGDDGIYRDELAVLTEATS